MARQHYSENVSQKDRDKFGKFLAEDEELILVTGLSQMYLNRVFSLSLLYPGAILMLVGLGIAYFGKYNLGYGLLAGLILALFYALFKTILTHYANRYLLTTRRVIIKKGVFAVKLTTALFDKITHIEVDQSFIDRALLKHGTIIINTAGSNKDEIIVRYISSPIEFKNILERLINREREQFGKIAGAIHTIDAEIVE